MALCEQQSSLQRTSVWPPGHVGNCFVWKTSNMQSETCTVSVFHVPTLCAFYMCPQHSKNLLTLPKQRSSCSSMKKIHNFSLRWFKLHWKKWKYFSSPTYFPSLLQNTQMKRRMIRCLKCSNRKKKIYLGRRNISPDKKHWLDLRYDFILNWTCMRGCSSRFFCHLHYFICQWDFEWGSPTRKF